jgi:Rrf2 family iron-sulfur cluster assembly transcriptional regulator
MKLSTKGRYAVTAIMAVAIGETQKPVTLAEISEEQGISISYLEQIFARLRKSALVKGTRGPGGGYCLARSTHDISVADIVTAVEDQERVQRPVGNGHINGRTDRVNGMWAKLSTRIYDHLRGVTLADLLIEGDTTPTDMARDNAPKLKVVAGKHPWAV